MAFPPQPFQEISIDGITYHFAEHPAAPGMPYGQEGRAGTVYKLEAPQGSQALKVFKSRFRTPALVSLAEQIAQYASLKGLTVCKRTVLTPLQHRDLLKQHHDLTYAVLMPWIEGPTWLEMVIGKELLTPQHSLSFALQLAEILLGMEMSSLAHCDISGANLLLTPNNGLEQHHLVITQDQVPCPAFFLQCQLDLVRGIVRQPEISGKGLL